MGNTHERTVGLLKSGLIAALYVVITVALIPWSFGPVQWRLAEMLNNLAVFNKRYIWALTLGCLIANLWSSLGAVDVVFGSLGTLMMTGVSYLLSRYTESVPRKLVISVISCTVLTWSVALEMFFVSHIPFWATYLSVAIGELISMIIGAVAFWLISLRIDLTK